MRSITLQGLGILGGFGTGIDAWAEALEAGRAPLSSLVVPTGKGPVELPAFRADTRALEERVPARVLRRMDHFTRMGLLGAHLALEDAGLGILERKDLGLVVASGFGPTATTYALLDSIINDGDGCTSPIHFANSLHNACAANIALNLGITGPNLTVSQFGLSVPSALLTARQWLLDGRVDRVLFGALDELSELTGYLWWRHRGITAPPSVPGEGAAFFLLSRVDEERPGYCTLGDVFLGQDLPLGSAAPDLLLIDTDIPRESAARCASETCFSDLRGVFPAAFAFDLAAGALILKRHNMFPSPFPAGPLNINRIASLTRAEEDGYGWVELGKLAD